MLDKWVQPAARGALFIVFFWFGLLKVLGSSPASPLVGELLQATLPIMSFPTFLIAFGALEMVIGILFLFPRFTRLVIFLFTIHMVTTFMPLVLLPQITWQEPFVPTLEGQYIIKNAALIALVISLAAGLKQRTKV